MTVGPAHRLAILRTCFDFLLWAPSGSAGLGPSVVPVVLRTSMGVQFSPQRPSLSRSNQNPNRFLRRCERKSAATMDRVAPLYRHRLVSLHRRFAVSTDRCGPGCLVEHGSVLPRFLYTYGLRGVRPLDRCRHRRLAPEESGGVTLRATARVPS